MLSSLSLLVLLLISVHLAFWSGEPFKFGAAALVQSLVPKVYGERKPTRMWAPECNANGSLAAIAAS
eukprot:3473344-Amphidinium_carterae.1